MKIHQMQNSAVLMFLVIFLLVFFATALRLDCKEPDCEETVCISEDEPRTEFETEPSVLINVESENINEPELILCHWGDFCLTEYEYELICTTVFCESGNQDFQTQVMVCLTILNRYADKSGEFADTISGVIYQHGAYKVTTWADFRSIKWTEQVERAVKYALTINDYPADMFFFRTEHYHTFGEPYMQSGDLWFSTEGRTE